MPSQPIPSDGASVANPSMESVATDTDTRAAQYFAEEPPVHRHAGHNYQNTNSHDLSASGGRGREVVPQRVGRIAWYVVQTRPHQETRAEALLSDERTRRQNILETYCPTHKSVHMEQAGRIVERPLFAGKVFVLGTEDAINGALRDRYPDGHLAYDRTQGRVMTVPELQMLFFMDFNEHYPEQVLVLERPYTDYAFNPKAGEPNEVVMVVDGPFAGKTGYLIRHRRNRRLVFQMHGMAVSIPDVWNYRLRRLHNAASDRQSKATACGRAVDFLCGIVQQSGFFGDEAIPMHTVLTLLAADPSISRLQDRLSHEIQNGHDTTDPRYARLSVAIGRLSAEGASALLTLADYCRTDHTLMASVAEAFPLRPFLTPTAWGEDVPQTDDTLTVHTDRLTELVRRLRFTESTYQPDLDSAEEQEVVYYAHLGILRKTNGHWCVMADWTPFLAEYLLLGGEAKERQMATFRTFSPLLHDVLSGRHRVKVERDVRLAGHCGHVLCIHVPDTAVPADRPLSSPAVAEAVSTLADTCLALCLEISGNAHLAIWRRLLRGVWLHR